MLAAATVTLVPRGSCTTCTDGGALAVLSVCTAVPVALLITAAAEATGGSDATTSWPGT